MIMGRQPWPEDFPPFPNLPWALLLEGTPSFQHNSFPGGVLVSGACSAGAAVLVAVQHLVVIMEWGESCISAAEATPKAPLKCMNSVRGELVGLGLIAAPWVHLTVEISYSCQMYHFITFDITVYFRGS